MERQLEMSIESQKRIMQKFQTFVEELLEKLESAESANSDPSNNLFT